MSHMLGFLPRSYDKMDRIPLFFEQSVPYEPLHPQTLWVVNSRGQWVMVEAQKMRKGDNIIARSAYVQCVPEVDPEASLLVLLHEISKPVSMKAALKKHGEGCVVVSRTETQHSTLAFPAFPLPGHLVVSSLLAHGFSNVVMTPHGLYYAGVCIDPQEHVSFVAE